MSFSVDAAIVFFFKKKSAYDIGVRLVGSEICIRHSLYRRGDLIGALSTFSAGCRPLFAGVVRPDVGSDGGQVGGEVGGCSGTVRTLGLGDRGVR